MTAVDWLALTTFPLLLLVSVPVAYLSGFRAGMAERTRRLLELHRQRSCVCDTAEAYLCRAHDKGNRGPA